MPQEQHELLNQRHLNQDVAGTNKQEVEKRPFCPWRLGKDWRSTIGGSSEDDERGDDADGHQSEEDRQGGIDFVIGRFARSVQDELPEITRLNRVEEERPVVANWADIELIVFEELRRGIGFKQSAERGIAVVPGK